MLFYFKNIVTINKIIKNSGKNYVILRLGSVYGYSTDTARIDIMPNLFSKITSQNGTIKLFCWPNSRTNDAQSVNYGQTMNTEEEQLFYSHVTLACPVYTLNPLFSSFPFM